MKSHQSPKSQKPAGAMPPGTAAKKVYFSYVNQGSRYGHEAQHWLAAEAELLAERKRTRVNGPRHRT